MEEKFISYFTEEEIDYIYECLLEYSMRNYEKMNEGAKIELQKKYNHAKSLITKTIDLSDQELEDFLLKTQSKYQENIKANQEMIEVSQHIPIISLKKEMPADFTNKEKIYYLLNFLIRYVTYSQRYFNYCTLIPPTKGIEFDFKSTIPVEHSISNVLVQGQGVCEDICNTMTLLGKEFNLPINTIFVEYNNRLYAINTLTVNNQISLIDTTRMIREGSIIDDYCLVDKDTLNKNEEYEFEETMENTITVPKTDITTNYKMTNIIQEIRSFLPKTETQVQIQKTI